MFEGGARKDCGWGSSMCLLLICAFANGPRLPAAPSPEQNNWFRICMASGRRSEMRAWMVQHRLDCSQTRYTRGSLAWRAHPRSTQDYLREFAGSLPELCRIPGWHLQLHRFDPMHCIFLGLGLHALGSCLIDLATAGHWPGANLPLRLRRAWHRGHTYACYVQVIHNNV